MGNADGRGCLYAVLSFHKLKKTKKGTMYLHDPPKALYHYTEIM